MSPATDAPYRGPKCGEGRNRGAPRSLIGPMNEIEIQERVRRCRRLAKGINDDRTIKALHDLADSYQRQADAMGNQSSLFAGRLSG